MLESIRKIIVPTDFSELSNAALHSAARLARQDDASVHLLHSIRLPFLHTNYDVNVPEAVWEGIRKGTRESMYESQLLLEEAGVSEVDLIVSESRQPAEAVSQASRELSADLVVMASHGRRGIAHAFLGSVTERTIRTSPIPVLAVKEKAIAEIPLARILLATDFSAHSDVALDLASVLARRYDAHLEVVHVLDRTPEYLRYGSAASVAFDKEARLYAARRLDSIGSDLRAEALAVHTHLPEGHATEVISEEAKRLNADLIVMGTHGLTGLAHAVIGSVTARTLRLAECPVLTTRATEGPSTANA